MGRFFVCFYFLFIHPWVGEVKSPPDTRTMQSPPDTRTIQSPPDACTMLSPPPAPAHPGSPWT